MDFFPLFWLSPFQGFPKSLAEFYCPEFLPLIFQANRFRLFFSRSVPLILCHHGQKFMATLRGTKIKLRNLLQYIFVTPNFDLLSIFDYLYFKTFQSPRQQFNIFCSEYITLFCIRMEPEFITDTCAKIQYSLCPIGNRLSLLSILTKICSERKQKQYKNTWYLLSYSGQIL